MTPNWARSEWLGRFIHEKARQSADKAAKISGMDEKEALLESLRRYKETLSFNYRSKSRSKVHDFIDTMTSDQCSTAPIDYSLDYDSLDDANYLWSDNGMAIEKCVEISTVHLYSYRMHDINKSIVYV